MPVAQPVPSQCLTPVTGPGVVGNSNITNSEVLGPIFPDRAPVAQTFDHQPRVDYEHSSCDELLYDCFEEVPSTTAYSSATGSAQAECKQQ